MSSRIQDLLPKTLQLTTDIKPTNIICPTIAAGTPPDRPAGADAVDAGIMAGVPVSADICTPCKCPESFPLTSLLGVRYIPA